MSKQSLVILTAAASVCAVLSAHGQVVQPTPGVPGDYVLPDGGAKTLVQENCTICHNLRNIVNSNKSQEDWQNTVNMMRSAGSPINDAQAEQIKAYLIASFPEKPRPKPAAINGQVQIKFQQWSLPTPGERPHDPLAMPDGSLWWSGQFAETKKSQPAAISARCSRAFVVSSALWGINPSLGRLSRSRSLILFKIAHS